MAKNQPKPAPISATSLAETIWKIQVSCRNADEVTIDVEPGDAEKYWSRLTPAAFLCENERSYTLIAPEQVGHNQFKHWVHPRTDTVVSDNPRLVLDAVKRNDRYIAVYEQRIPCDISFKGVSSNSRVTIRANKPDLSGRTEVAAPGTFTYMFGDNVTFSVDPIVKIGLPDVLYGQVNEIYTLLGWKQGGEIIGRDTYLQLSVPRKSQDITVAYTRTPAPFTPDERQVHIMSRQLNLMYEQEEPDTREVVVLIGGKLVKLFGKLLFPSKENAEAVLRGSFNATYRDWLNRLPERLKAWCLDQGQRDMFFNHWSKESVQIVPYSELEITKKRNVEHSKNKA